jgi:paraquat-inducible protein B
MIERRRRNPALWVGLFVIGALVLGVAAFLWLTGSRWFERQQLAVIQFRGGVSGLYVGAPVTFRGVPVGQVESIGIEVDAKSLEARIPVQVRLQPDSVRFSAGGGSDRPSLDTLVQRGLRARLVAQSFVTGQKAIDLDFVRDAPPVAAATAGSGARPEIPVVADRLDALFDQFAQLPMRETVDDLRLTMQTLRTTLDEVRGTVVAARATIDRAGADLGGVASQGKRTLAETTATLAALRSGVQASLASVNVLLERSRTVVDQAQPELQATLVSARAAAAAAEQAMQRVNELTDPRAPLRGDLDGAVRDLSQSARALREWSELLEERPNAVIFGRRESRSPTR